MKRVVLVLAALVFVQCASFAQVSVQVGLGTLGYVSGGVANFPKGGANFQFPGCITAGLGYNFSESFQLDAVGIISLPQIQLADFAYTYTQAGLQGTYRFLGNNSTPYVTLGAGLANYVSVANGTNGALFVQAGLGYQLSLSEKSKLFAEAQYALHFIGEKTLFGEKASTAQVVPIRLGIKFLF